MNNSSDIYINALFDASSISLFVTDGVGNILKQNSGAIQKFGELNNSNLFDIISFTGNIFYSPQDLIESEVEGKVTIGDDDFYFSISAMKVKVTDFQYEYLFFLIDRTEMHLKNENFISLQNKMMENSYRDGVAESAVSTLHNIGNILTSIITNIPDESHLKSLEVSAKVINKISKILKDENLNNEKVLLLLSEMEISLIEQYKKLTRINTEINRKCLHIGDVIQAQQNYANFKSQSAIKISPVRLIDECLLLFSDLTEKLKIDPVKIIKNNSYIFMDKIGLSQTFSNVLKNAFESIQERINEHEDYIPELHIIVERIKSYLLITVIDNAKGIKKDLLENLYNFGFSTKNRSSGFGLHNCSNFMLQNKGKIKILSEGENMGAKVILFCPVFEE